MRGDVPEFGNTEEHVRSRHTGRQDRVQVGKVFQADALGDEEGRVEFVADDLLEDFFPLHERDIAQVRRRLISRWVKGADVRRDGPGTRWHPSKSANAATAAALELTHHRTT
jgi:hypothetical protein